MTKKPEPQYVVDAMGKRLAVILSIEDYEALVQQTEAMPAQGETARRSLYGALRHLGTLDVTTEEIDQARRELWGDWDKKEF